MVVARKLIPGLSLNLEAWIRNIDDPFSDAGGECRIPVTIRLRIRLK